MADNGNFKEVYNVWYFLAAVGVLLALPLMHVILGWFTFVIAK
jgi:hypothetical protein